MKPALHISGTFPTPEGDYIQPRRDPSVFENGSVLTGQVDPMLAHSWALRNYDADVIFSLGKMQFRNAETITYMIARNREDFLASLHLNELGQRGGFIHRVDTEDFELMPDRVGQMKWFSRQPVRVIEAPRFISLEEVMSHGVQVFILEDKSFIKALAEGRKQHPLIIRDGLDRGTLSCLNESYGYAQQEIPAPDLSMTEPSRSNKPLQQKVVPTTLRK